MFAFQFVASTINRESWTSRRTKIHLVRSPARMMMVRRGQADVIGIIGIMWMGKARVTGAESRRISDGVGGTTEMHMNGRHRVRARRRRANTRRCCTRTLLVPVPQSYCLVYLVVISVLEGPDDGPVNTSLGKFLLLLCIQPARLEGRYIDAY